MNYPYGYMPPGYPNPYYPQAPSHEYLEQRRISMPLNPNNNMEQQYFNEQPAPSQFRSNSMADAMNPKQFNWQGNVGVKHSRAPPPGLQKSNQESMKHYQMGKIPNEEGQDMSNFNSDFAQMSINARNQQKIMHKHGGIIPGTGEISCHSNSTIKEEEFDSERDAYERNSDSSSNKASYNRSYDPNYYQAYNKPSKQHYQGLVDEEMLRNQKRRESQQIPVTSLEDRKIMKSSMKSNAMAFVPKQKDSRTGSMPNIFQPRGTKEQYNYNTGQENPPYYRFNTQNPPHPSMLNFNSGMMGAQSQNNDQYDAPTPTSMTNMGGLVPPIMPDYKYEERRNSGTTGGSSNIKGLKGNFNKNKAFKGQNPNQHNKARRSSNTNPSIQIPSNEKNVMEYKGQIAMFAKTQQGSKYLQRVLAKASPEVLEFVVVEVGDHLHELMTDSYGNYFCQKLLQSSSSKQRLYLLKKISPHLVKIACDKRGTHSMQSLIQLINMEEEEVALEEAITGNVILLSFDPNGTYVLQKVILTIKVNKLDYIFYD